MDNGVEFEEFMKMSREEIEKVAKEMANTLVQTCALQEEEEFFPVVVDISDYLDLDQLASSVAGITDPLGQLKSWLTNTLNSIASWIASTIEASVKGFVDWLNTSIGGMISGLESVIRGLIDGVLGAISDLSATVQKVVIDPIMNAINEANKFLADLPGMISEIGDAISGVIDGIMGIVNTVGSAIEGLIKTVQDALSPVFDTISNVISSISGMVESIGKTISDVVSGMVSAVQEAFKPIFDTIANIGAGIVKMIEDAGKTITGIISGIQEAIKPVFDAIATLGDMIGKAIENAIATVGTWVEEAGKMISGLIESIGKLGEQALGLIGTLAEGIKGILPFLDNIRKGFESFLDYVFKLPELAPDIYRSVFTQLWSQYVEPVWNAIYNTIVKPLEEAFKGIVEKVSVGFETISKTFQGFVNAVLRLPEFIVQVANAITGLGDFIAKIPEIISSLVEEIRKFLTDPLGYLKGVVDHLASQIWNMLPDWFKAGIEEIRTFFANLWGEIQKFVADPWGYLFKRFEDIGKWIWEALPDWLKSAIEGIKDFFSNLWEEIQKFVKDPWAYLLKKFEDMGKWIWEALPDWLKGAIEKIRDFFTDLWNSLTEFFTNPVKFIEDRLSWLAGEIWKKMEPYLPEWLKNAIKFWGEVFEKIKNFIIGEVTSFVDNPFKWIVDKIAKAPEIISTIASTVFNIFKKIYESLPENIRKFINSVVLVLYSIVSKIALLITNPPEAIGRLFKWLYENVYMKLPEWIRTIFFETWKIAYYRIRSIWRFYFEPETFWEEDAMWVVNTLTILLTPAMNYASAHVRGLYDVFVEWLKPFIKLAEEPVKEFYKLLLTEVAEYHATIIGRKLDETVTKATGRPIGVEARLEEAKRIDGGKMIYDVLITTVPITATIKLIPELLRSISYKLDQAIGTAIRGVSALATGVGAVAGGGGHSYTSELVALANTLDYAVWGLFRWASWGITYWVFEPLNEPLRMMIRYLYRDVVPFRIPVLADISRIVQRHLAIEDYEVRKAYETLMKDLMGLHGYPTYIADFYIRTYEDLGAYDKIVVKDRFGQDRTYPLPLVYGLPTASEMCRMMVKDIFGSLSDFAKAIKTRGYEKDIAYMYYLLHFRYPPPSTLWEFTCRGISGLLWFIPTSGMITTATEEARKIGAYAPIVPPALNFDYSTLFKSLFTYMKWHDYARFSWIDGFTSDNWIVIDTLADIPTKIDIRWMVKWGIFEYMTEKGIGLKTPVLKFPGILEGAPASLVRMDLTLMCRLLQATGLHPYYVPIVSVAETVNALADERTLLRTGVMNLYEEGMLDFETLDELLSGLVIASFKVSYYDMVARDWRSAWFNLPVAYLPAERRLLTLRSLIDRYHRLYKDILRDVERAYREYIIEDIEEGISAMEKLVEMINPYFRALSKAITGKEIVLSVDEDYVTACLEAQFVEREIFTVRRVRYWFSRIMGWLIYRLAYAYVTVEDVERILDVTKKIAKLTDPEVEALKTIMSLMTEIAGREYIPTPSMLATISEIVPKARAFFGDVVRARRVPARWVPIWAEYVAIKPVVDEVKSVLSSTERLYEYFIITDEDVNRLMERLKLYGWEEYEIKLIWDRLRLDRWYRAYREIVGTIRELTTLAEYSPRARSLALGEAYKMIDALPVDRATKDFLKKMWEEYIRLKPVMDEVRRYITELMSDFVEGVITEEEYVTELEALREWGLDDWEIMFYKAIGGMRKARYLRRMARAS